MKPGTLLIASYRPPYTTPSKKWTIVLCVNHDADGFNVYLLADGTVARTSICIMKLGWIEVV